MNDLLYCYPDSDVLKNKLGIINQENSMKWRENSQQSESMI